jgi:hypothetical protein
MKKERFAVIRLDKRNGWMMFASSPDGSSFAHNPFQMATFEEKEADEIVRKLTAHVAEVTPALVDDICISKVKLA